MESSWKLGNMPILCRSITLLTETFYILWGLQQLFEHQLVNKKMWFLGRLRPTAPFWFLQHLDVKVPAHIQLLRYETNQTMSDKPDPIF